MELQVPQNSEIYSNLEKYSKNSSFRNKIHFSHLCVQVAGNWSTGLPSSSTVNMKSSRLKIWETNSFWKGDGQREGGVHPGPLLPPPPLQRDQLPQVVEQELQGHQPLALLHHVRREEQHCTRFSKKTSSFQIWGKLVHLYRGFELGGGWKLRPGEGFEPMW